MSSYNYKEQSPVTGILTKTTDGGEVVEISSAVSSTFVTSMLVTTFLVVVLFRLLTYLQRQYLPMNTG
ncbi:hypothetical protein [Anaplasma phagocytophilum]|uniref:hypothetical protein n=1 Tax=Anaplasma phagocytophilum TaxID=948 RepID=UPI00200BA93A|nr:hypothetical protein [Anaplasma phagocytophilum]UQD54114.1 hypothetical protein ESP60_01410 [Anaplasma phagocytophilum]